MFGVAFLSRLKVSGAFLWYMIASCAAVGVQGFAEFGPYGSARDHRVEGFRM